MIPSNVEFTYRGTSSVFLRRMSSVTNALDDMFGQMSKVGLDQSFAGVRKVRIVEKMEAGLDLAAYDPSQDQISIFPMAWQQGSRIDMAFYSGFGLRHWLRNIGQVDRVAWLKKEAFANRAYTGKISEWFDGKTPFDQIMGRVTDPSCRLMILAIIQMLTGGGIEYKDFAAMRLADCPATKDFISGAKPYCIQPLIQRYGGGTINISSYEGAFASFCSHNGRIALSDDGASIAITALFKKVSGIL